MLIVGCLLDKIINHIDEAVSIDILNLCIYINQEYIKEIFTFSIYNPYLALILEALDLKF